MVKSTTLIIIISMVLPFVQLKATRVSTTTCGEICHPEIKPNLPDTNATVKKKKSLFDRFLSYFNDANKNKKQKKFDFSIIGGPHYSEDTKLGLGLVAAGLYKTDMKDSLLSPSNVSLFGDVSTVGFYMLGIRGNHIFPKDRFRLDYNLRFYSFPSYFWGIGYDMGNKDSNKTKMERWQAEIEVNFLIKIIDNLYLGPKLSYDFVKGSKLRRPELLNGMDLKTINFGLGWSVVYDSRDVITNPHKGWYANLSQCFRPKWLWNDYAFTTTDLNVRAYTPLWRGCTFASEVRGVFNTGNPPWAMMALLGNSYSMRGYYEGRYRDKHKIEGQIELRQHIWKRNGIVTWIGAGSVFNSFEKLNIKRVLPNYGIGYRWEFKKDVNVRLDYGFGKSGQSGFLFQINEAF